MSREIILNTSKDELRRMQKDLQAMLSGKEDLIPQSMINLTNLDRLLIDAIGDHSDDEYITPSMSFDEWSEQYTVIKEIDSCDFDDGIYNKLRDKNNFHSLWTEIEESGKTFIVPGYWKINRLRYYITEEEWKNYNMEIILNPNEEEKEGEVEI